MRQRQWFALCVVVVFAGLVAAAAEKPSEEYRKAMQTLGTFTAGIDKEVAAEDWDAVAKMGESARDAFELAEKYWDGKDADAKSLALEGAKQSQDLVAVAGQKSREGAEFAVSEIKATCGTCHAAHREAQSDGTFLIK